MQNRIPSITTDKAPPHPCPEVLVHAASPEELAELWEAPTVRELADRVEHQFGNAPALANIYTLGFGSDEPLSPCDVHLVCDLLGLPAEDFGVDV